MKNKNFVVVYLARTYQWVILMPLIDLIYYTAIVQFSIFSKNPLLPVIFSQATSDSVGDRG